MLTPKTTKEVYKWISSKRLTSSTSSEVGYVVPVGKKFKLIYAACAYNYSNIDVRQQVGAVYAPRLYLQYNGTSTYSTNGVDDPNAMEFYEGTTFTHGAIGGTPDVGASYFIGIEYDA